MPFTHLFNLFFYIQTQKSMLLMWVAFSHTKALPRCSSDFSGSWQPETKEVFGAAPCNRVANWEYTFSLSGQRLPDGLFRLVWLRPQAAWFIGKWREQMRAERTQTPKCAATCQLVKYFRRFSIFIRYIYIMYATNTLACTCCTFSPCQFRVEVNKEVTWTWG